MERNNANEEERVMVFLDLANVEKSFKEIDFGFRVEIDYSDLLEELLAGRKSVGNIVYDTDSLLNPKNRVSVNLNEAGFRFSMGKLIENVQKEVDTKLCVDMLSYAFDDRYDTAILISGDRDMRPAVEAVQARGKRVEVASFRNASSAAMVAQSDSHTELDTLPVVVCEIPVWATDDFEYADVSDAVYGVC